MPAPRNKTPTKMASHTGPSVTPNRGTPTVERSKPNPTSAKPRPISLTTISDKLIKIHLIPPSLRTPQEIRTLMPCDDGS